MWLLRLVCLFIGVGYIGLMGNTVKFVTFGGFILVGLMDMY